MRKISFFILLFNTYCLNCGKILTHNRTLIRHRHIALQYFERDGIHLNKAGASQVARHLATRLSQINRNFFA